MIAGTNQGVANPGEPITSDAFGVDTRDHATMETGEPGQTKTGDESTDKSPVASRGTHTPEGAEPEVDALANIRDELHRGVESGIERIVSIFPEIGKDSDTWHVLDSVQTTASSNVPQPPAAAQAVLSLCRRSDYSLHQLTELVERDPALSAALLSHANSAWYLTGDGRPVLGLRSAVHRVGAKGVHASVMSTILEGAMSRPGPKFSATARMVWNHMVRVAPIARQLAPAFGADADAAFSLGLLHDVGKLVLFHHISDLRRSRRREIVISDEFLWLALTSLHEPLGGLAILEWGLDQESAHIVANHHRFPKPEPEDVLTEVVFLAERIDIAEQHGQTLAVEPLWRAAALTGPMEEVKDFVRARIEGDFSLSGLRPSESPRIDETIHDEYVPTTAAGTDD